MADFEVMPVGTRAEMEKASKLLREVAPKIHSKRSAVFRGVARNLEWLLEQQRADAS